MTKDSGKKTKNTPKSEHSSRRQVLTGLGAVGAAGLLAACDGGADNQVCSTLDGAPAINAGKRTLRMVTTWPKNFPGAGTGAESFAKRISAMTDGRITIRVYAAGELVPAFGAFDAVSSGSADLYHGAEYYWQGRSPAFNFFGAVPFGMTPMEVKAWVYYGGGQELWDALSARFGVKAFMCGNTGTQMGGWFRREINSIDDFSGLRMRIPGLGGEVIRRLGGEPVTRAGGEIFLALSQGNIDAAEWVGPWNDLAFGFQSIVKNYYYPGFHEPGTILSLGMNKDLWDDLSTAEQTMFSAAAAMENDTLLAEYDVNNARALKTLVNEHGVHIRPFPDDVLRQMGAVSGEVLAETAASDPETQAVYDSFMAALVNLNDWGEMSDRAIARARALLAN